MVISASPIATTGGKSDHNVPTGLVMLPVNAQRTPNATMKAIMSTLGIIFFAAIMFPPKNDFKLKNTVTQSYREKHNTDSTPQKCDSILHILQYTNGI